MPKLSELLQVRLGFAKQKLWGTAEHNRIFIVNRSSTHPTNSAKALHRSYSRNTLATWDITHGIHVTWVMLTNVTVNMTDCEYWQTLGLCSHQRHGDTSQKHWMQWTSIEIKYCNNEQSMMTPHQQYTFNWTVKFRARQATTRDYIRLTISHLQCERQLTTVLQ